MDASVELEIMAATTFMAWCKQKKKKERKEKEKRWEKGEVR